MISCQEYVLFIMPECNNYIEIKTLYGPSVSGLTFIMHAERQKIRKPTNSKLFCSTKSLNMIYNIWDKCSSKETLE